MFINKQVNKDFTPYFLDNILYRVNFKIAKLIIFFNANEFKKPALSINIIQGIKMRISHFENFRYPEKMDKYFTL
jgi:hypothetical protein